MAGACRKVPKARPCACRYLISQHPEVEKKILAELEELQLLKTAQNPKAREMTYADLSKLTYLNAVIKVLQLLPCMAVKIVVSCLSVFSWQSDALCLAALPSLAMGVLVVIE